MNPRLLFSALMSLLAPMLSAKDEPPVVIAHRGASGYLPEHTLAAKALAHGMGAHFLEQDVVLTKDGVPVVMHDIHLDTISDVAVKFHGRQRTDGRFYALDFTLAEIRQLEVTERLDHKTGQAAFPKRFPAGASGLRIVTLEEELIFIKGLNHSSGRRAGIYPEIKQPAWHLAQGVDLSRAVLEVLRRHGYEDKTAPCWLQCFEHDEVRRLRGELGWRGRLVQLMSAGLVGTGGSDYARMRTPEGLTELAGLVDAIGPAISSIITGTNPEKRRLTTLVADAHRAGLAVHPYTVRADDLPKTVRSLDELHHLLFQEAGIDGVFTDFPDLTARYLAASEVKR